MNRGSDAGRRRRGSGTPRFNEAPIHESGKLLTIRSASADQARFNEAPIHESGKFHLPSL